MADRVSLSAASTFSGKKKETQDKVSLSSDDKTKSGAGLGYFAGNVGLGLLGIAEGAIDLTYGAVDQLFGGELGKKRARYLHDNDYTGDLTQKLNDYYNPGKIGKFFGDVGQGIGQSSVFYLNALLPGVGTGIFFGGAAGRSLTEAYQQTGELGFKEYGYAATEGAVEAALEMLTNGGAPGLDKGKDTLVGGIKKLLGKSAKEGATSAIRNGIVKNVISEASGEFLEEFIESYTGVLNQRLFQIDPNASVSLGEALYSGLVGAASGGLMSGVSSSVRAGYSNYRGNKVISEGKAQNLVDTAKVIQDYVKSNDWSKYANKDDIRGNLNDLIAAYQAYQGLEESQRTGARAAVYLGEMQYNMAVLEAAVGSARIQDDIKEKAEQYVEYVKKAYGEDFTAEDIRNNRDGVLQKLAVHRWAGMFNDSVTVGEAHEQWVREQLEKHKRAETDIPADVTAETTKEERAVTITGKTKDGIEYSENDTGDVISRVYDVGEGRSAIAVQNDDGTWTVEAGTDDNLLDNEAEKIGTKVKAENLDGVILNIRDNFDDLVIQATENRDRRIAEAEKAEKEAEEAKEKKEKKAERERKIRSVFKDSDRTYYASEDDLRFAEIEDEKVIKSKLNFKQMAIAKLLDKWLGKNYRIALFEGNGKGRIGAYKAGTIYIDVNASMLQVTAHELVHSFAAKNAKHYDALAGFIVEKLFKGDQSKMDAAVQEYIDKYKEAGVNLTADEAKEELIAKSCEKVFGSVQGIRDILTYNKGLFKAAFSFFDKAVSIFEEIITAEGEGNKYAEELAADVEAIKKVRDMFAEEMGKEYNSANDKTKLDVVEESEQYKDYDKPITVADISSLRDIVRNHGGRRVSINDFSSDEIRKTQKWAYKFYKELETYHKGYGVKSPYFRAWFGEWRAHDVSEYSIVKSSMERYSGAGDAVNDDTGKKISWGDTVRKETTNHAVKEKVSLYALGDIDKIIKNAILFDSDISDKTSKSKMENTAFMHSFYSAYERGGKIYLLKLFVEEALPNKGGTPFTRAYQLKDIEKIAELPNGVLPTNNEGLTDDNPTTIGSISDLYSLVKTFDKNFHPGKEVSSAVLNEDGTPKVFYHGTSESFSKFDKSKIGKNYPAISTGGFYFTSKKQSADYYGRNGKTLSVFLNLSNPYYVDLDSMRNWDGSPADYFNAADWYDNKSLELDAQAKGNEHDGIYIKYRRGDLAIAFEPSQIKSAIDNIGTFDGRNDNFRYDISDTDSEGKTLSDGQREFFRNSKVVDEDGNLRRVYHGTDEDFTVFDRTKGRSTMDIQGMFFSPWELDAKGYGSKVGEYYLNITNPASESEGYKALNRFKGQNDAGVKAREYLISQGYDGVNNGDEEYIAFYPEQVKRTDNVNPTEDRDVRFDISEENGYTAAEQDAAREIVKEYDMFLPEKRRSISEFIRSTKGTKADKATIKAVANIIAAADGLDVRFADSKEKGLIVSEDGKRLIILDKGLESSEAIRRTLSAEIIHMAEDTENYGRFAKMILSGVTEEQKNAVKAKYEKFWKEYGVEATDEEILRECVSEIGADLMMQDDIVKAWANKDRKLAYRILVGARSLARRLFGKNKEAYKQAARLTETLAAAVAEGELRRYTGAPKIQWSLSERRESERNERLKAEVEYLKELVRLQGQITDGKKFTKASLEKVARDIKKQSGSIGKTDELVSLLNDFYTYCAENTIENGKFDYDALVAQAQKVVDWIYQNHYSKDQYDDYHQGLIDYLKNKRIYISPKLQAEIASQFGSYKEFRDALMGYVMFTKDGTPLDSWWQELSSLYPALFDAEAVEGDQPGQLYEAVENLKGNPMPDEYFNPEYEESTKMDIFSRVFDGYWNLTKMTTVADKYAAKISELEAKHKEEIQKLKEANAEKVKEAKKKAAEELKKEAREIHYFTRGKAKKTLKQIVDEYVGKYVTDPDELKGAERDFSRDLVEIPEGARITVRGLDSVVEKLYQGMYAADNKTAIAAAAKEIAADLMNRLIIKGEKEISVKEMLDSRNVALATEAEGQIRDRITAILNGEEVLSDAGKVRQRYENLLKRYREETLKRTDELRAEIEAAKGTNKATLQAIEQISRAKRQYKDGNYKYRGILSAPVMQVLSDFVIKAKTRGGFLDPAGVRRAMAAYTDMLAVTDVSADLAEEYEALGLDPNVARDLGDTVREVLKGMDFNNEEMMKSKLYDAEIETFADVARAVAQLYRTYNKYYDEKRKEWVDADETAKKAISNVETTVSLHEGDKKVVKAFRELMDKYGIEGLDPLAVAKLMDGYAPDGVMTDIMRDIINAENAKTYRIQQYMKEVDDFISSTKGFEKHLTSEEDMVEYKGVKLTRDEFIQLYMTTFRKQALLHLGLGRMEFGSVNDKNGIRIIAPAIESRRFEDTDLAKKAPSLEELQNDCERVVTDIRKLADSVLTEEDKKYIALMEKFYNEVSTKDKSETDFKYFGMTNVVEDPTDRYVPIVTSSSSRASSITDERSSMLEFSTLSGQSFNKNTIKGAKNPLSFTGAYQLMQKHANGLAAYVELYAPMQKLDRVWSADINHDKQNSNRLRDIISRTYGDNCEKYIRSLMGDIQGINKKKPNAFNAVIAKLRSNYAVFQLGANPKTWFNQLGSMGALYRFCDMDSIAKGLTSPNKDVMGKYSTAAAIREDSDVAVQAQALTKQVKGKLTNLLMKPIGYSDMLIVGMSWGACQYQVQKEKGFAVGSEENLKAAGELLDRVINESQDTSMASTKTGIARADNDLIKGLAMFRSAPFKQTARLVDAFGTIDRIRAEKKAGMEVSEERVKEANKELGRTLSGWALQAAIGVAVGALFSWLYKKDDDKDAKDYVVDFSSELISVIPILGDAYGYFASGYDLSYFAFDMANDALKATKNTATLIGDGVTGKKVSRQDVAKLVYDDSQVLGQFTGIPIRNVKNFFTGITKRVSSIFGGSLGYSLDGVLYKPSYASDLSKAIEDGNDKLANTIISMMYSDKKATEELSDTVAKEIIRLYGEGHTSILPPTVGDTITVDGVSYDVKAKDQKKIRSIANKADAEIVQMMQGAIYQGMDDNARAKAVEKLYKLYYDRAVNDTFGVPMSKIDALARLGDAKEIFAAAGNIAGIANDVDQNGKAVSGSRKLKVETYLSGLNVSEDTKNLIRYAAGYSGEDLKKEIRKIVEKSAADDKEMEEIYEALGLE